MNTAKKAKKGSQAIKELIIRSHSVTTYLKTCCEKSEERVLMVDYLARIDQLERSWQSYRTALAAWIAAIDSGNTAGLPRLAADLARWLDEVGVARAAALRRECVEP